MASPQPYAFHAVTDVGRQREQNEDACGDVAAAGGVLLIVCDGMGGHEAGEVASRIAVDAIGQIFTNSPADDPSERLRSGFLVANQRIGVHAQQAGLDGMGTTATAAFVRDGEAWIAHVGDSRVYHVRGGAVLWRTADHTRVQKMVERGILTPEQAKTHEDANVVTRALGFARGEEPPEPDVAAGRALRDGDVLVLCSDGLHDLVPDDEIAAIADGDAPARTAQALVDLANERGGHDNITVAVLRWGAAPVAARGAPAGRKRRTALDEPGGDGVAGAPAAPAATATPTAPAAATAPADTGPRRALILVIVGVALVGLAAAVLLITRADPSAPGPAPTRPDAAAGVAPGVRLPDGGAGGATAPTSGDGGVALPPLPDWDDSAPGDPTRPRVAPRGGRDGGTAARPRGAGDAGTTTAAPVDAGAGATPAAPVDAGAGKPAAPIDAAPPLRPIGDAGTGGGGVRRDAGLGGPSGAGKPKGTGIGTGTGTGTGIGTSKGTGAASGGGTP